MQPGLPTSNNNQMFMSGYLMSKINSTLYIQPICWDRNKVIVNLMRVIDSGDIVAMATETQCYRTLYYRLY